MPSARSNNDIPADIAAEYPAFTELPTSLNNSQIYCSECDGVFYTDEERQRQWNRAIEQGIDNPFVCDQCSREEAELAHSEH